LKIFALSLAVLGISISPLSESPRANFASEQNKSELEDALMLVQDNSLLSSSQLPVLEASPVQKLRVIVTAYSSTPWETDEDPFITASGERVRDGIVANNLLPFGTKIRIPEIFGERIFIVEDRMHPRKGYYHVDVWFPSYSEAKSFGAKTTHVEILQN